MQNVVRQLGRERGGDRDRNKQLRGVDGKGAIEILGRDSHDGRVSPIQVKYLPQGVGRGVQAIAPETIANHHNGRVTGPVHGGAEHSATLGFDAEHGKIVGGYKLSKDTLGFAIQIAFERDVEWDAGLECSDPREQALLLTILLDVVVRHRGEITIRRLLKHHQVLGMRRSWKITEQQLPFRAVHVCRQPNSESHRNNADQREAGRLDQRSPCITHVAAHFAQVFERHAHGDVCDEPYQPGGSMPLGNFFHDVLPELHHLWAIGQFELVRKCLRQPPIDPPCEIHSVTKPCFTRMLRTNSSRRSHSASSTRLPRAVSR